MPDEAQWMPDEAPHLSAIALCFTNVDRPVHCAMAETVRAGFTVESMVEKTLAVYEGLSPTA